MERSPLDTDTLEVLLRILKDNEVTRFKWGDVEVEFDPPVAEPAASGFMPPVIVTPPGGELSGPTDARTLGYSRAHGGPMPRFLKPEPSKAGG